MTWHFDNVIFPGGNFPTLNWCKYMIPFWTVSPSAERYFCTLLTFLKNLRLKHQLVKVYNCILLKVLIWCNPMSCVIRCFKNLNLTPIFLPTVIFIYKYTNIYWLLYIRQVLSIKELGALTIVQNFHNKIYAKMIRGYMTISKYEKDLRVQTSLISTIQADHMFGDSCLYKRLYLKTKYSRETQKCTGIYQRKISLLFWQQQ